MASKKSLEPIDFTVPAVEVIDIDATVAATEMFSVYAAEVIQGRSLPDARDGLKPVHRRILFDMGPGQMGLMPDKPHVKVARIVGSTMGKWHPHGDSAIADSLVRMAQDFSVSVPLIDGHGNFGSLDAPAAAMRYIEARLARAALGLVEGTNENTVDMVPNYDGSMLEPSVLPAAYPNLLVNGAEGIAVGMATKLAPHNLDEAVAAARHLLAHPDATVDDLMRIIPGPDFPGGCQVITGDGAREAYETGKGTVTMRAVTRIEPIEGSRGRSAIIASALPYMVGPEKVVEAVKKGIADKKISFISDIIDLSEGDEMALHIELKAGVNAEQALATLFALTPMEQTFAIHSLALVGGKPKTLGLVEMLQVWLDFRKEVVLRRSQFRRGKAQDRLHLVEGLVKALDAIDLVVKTIRGSATTAEAREALMKHRNLKLSEVQASHVLEMPLRRLTSLEIQALQDEKRSLEATIADLTDIIDSPVRLVSVIDGELAEYATANATARVSALVQATSQPAPLLTAGSSASVTVDDREYTWHLTTEGILTTSPDPKRDVVVCAATVTGTLLLLCADGVAVKVPASVTDRMKAEVAASRSSAVVGLGSTSDTLIMGTRQGVVKALRPDWPQRGEECPYVALSPGDAVLWVGPVTDDADAVFATSDAQLLRFSAAGVRPQGRSGSGMAGVKLRPDAHVVMFCAAAPAQVDLVTVTDGGAGKTTALAEYPAKGRGTSGVRCHTFRSGHTALARAQVVPCGGRVGNERGKAVPAPARGKRDGSGT